MDSNLYKKTPVQVQKKSGFDKSFQNLYTAKPGELIPILSDEVIPNTTIHLNAAITAQLAPLASDTFMRCKLKYAAFFVPTRILVPRYEDWLTGADPNKGQNTEISMPTLKFTHGAAVKPGSLADFLGFKVRTDYITNLSEQSPVAVNALPFLAYHRIYEDWFRNSMIQRSIYQGAVPRQAMYYGASTSNIVAPIKTDHILQDNDRFVDGVGITTLRKANFDIDLFTTATTQAQNGKAQKVKIGTNDGEANTFTISQLRAANSLQQFLERNNIAGNRLVDYVKAQYGATLQDGVAQRSVLLGSGSLDVYNKGVYQTSDVQQSVNPFGTVAAKYGSAFADGKTDLIKNFTAMEPGYVFVIAWLSPRVTYATGIDPQLIRYTADGSASIADMANPILQNTGNEPLYAAYLQDSAIGQGMKSKVFGYNDRYATWKDKVDEVHGELRDGQPLDAFALQRSFGDAADQEYNVEINSDFLQIPVDYLDQVYAQEVQTPGGYGYWVDTYFDYKVSMPLARYSTPSLQDPAAEHGETVVVPTRGTQLT